MLASIPASILNLTRKLLGIPERFNQKQTGSRQSLPSACFVSAAFSSWVRRGLAR
jgi:hypothetical protein